jgi:hypothetical protein
MNQESINQQDEGDSWIQTSVSGHLYVSVTNFKMDREQHERKSYEDHNKSFIILILQILEQKGKFFLY